MVVYCKNIGISSGGYAAVVSAIFLEANRAFCFSGQFDIERRISEKTALECKENVEKRKYLNLIDSIKKYEEVSIYYFCPIGCSHDYENYLMVKDIKSVKSFLFPDKIHAATVYPFNFPDLLYKLNKKMDKLARRYQGVIVNKKMFFIRTVSRHGVYELLTHIFQTKFSKTMLKKDGMYKMNLIKLQKQYNAILNKEQKVIGVIVLFLSICGAILEMLGVSIIIPFANVLLAPEESFKSESYSKIVSIFTIESSAKLITFLSISIAFIYIVKNIYFIFLSWVRAKFIAKIERELSVSMMKKYMSNGYEYFTNTNTGTLLRGIQTDVSSVQMLLYNFMKFIIDFATILLIAIYMLFIDWALALGVGAMAGGCFFIVGKIFSRINMNAGVQSRTYLAKANQSLLQALQGIKEVLVLKKEDFFVNVYKKQYTQHLHSNLIRVICSESPAYIIEGTCVATIFAIICFRVSLAGVTDSLLPTLASFVVAAFRILPSIGKITSEYSAMNYFYAGLSAVYQNSQRLVHIDRLDNVIENDSSKEETITFEKEINVKDLTFSYPGSQPVINHMNMKIVKGEAVAFVGPSGSGKTTLSDIILGLLTPQEGKILVDGIDISLSPFNWSKMIGYVSQTIYLVDDTVRFNVAFGVEEENIDDKRVWDCLKKAQIDDYVSKMEKGIYTVVGDRGVKISGGQRQRIAIARALYHNPQILVLDEATSALDNDTEKAVMDSIEALQGQITLIIIAHRLSTVKKCDSIYEINNGVANKKNKEKMEFI